MGHEEDAVVSTKVRFSLLILATVWVSPAMAQSTVALTCKYAFKTDDKGVRQEITGEDSFRIQFLANSQLRAQSTECADMQGVVSDIEITLNCKMNLGTTVVSHEYRIDRIGGQFKDFMSFDSKVVLTNEGHCEIRKPLF